jgi:thiamine-phosphate diphosphorylase
VTAFPESSLYLITDRDLSRGRSISEVVKAALAGGVDVVQLRDKKVETSLMVADALRVRELTAQAGKPLIVNDRLDVALAIEADGAHVGQTDIPAAMARALLAAPRILGVSTSDADMTTCAYRDQADYIGFGPLYHTATKQTVASPRGLEMLPQVLDAVPIPVVVLGGISLDNIEDVVAAGADHVAVCSCIVAADDVQRAAATLKERMEKARAKRRAFTD